MDTTEQNNEQAPAAPAPKPKRKWTRRKARAPRPAAEKAPASDTAFLAGITASTCASGCNVKGCVISEKNYCAHPHKGGLQGRDIGNADCVNRFNAARQLLGTAALEKRFGK